MSTTVSTELAMHEPAPLAVQEPTNLLAVIARAAQDPAVDVEKMERLLAMAERMEARDAEKQFAEAFVRLRGALPTIEGARPVPARDGTVKYRYANFDDIDAVVGPICLAHGFTYSFHEQAISEGRVTIIMTLTHRGGHSRAIPYSVRIGSGPPGCTESQADVSGHSYAQRGAIESGLALRIVGGREDVRDEGTTISVQLADDLRCRVKATKSDEVKFLAFAGAETFEKILSSKIPALDAALRKREEKPL